MSQLESYRKFLIEKLEKVVFLRYSGLLFCFLNFTMGGVWTLAGALPIFNRINYRRGCSYEKVFPACHCDPELVSGEAISNHLLVGGILRPFRLR